MPRYDEYNRPLRDFEARQAARQAMPGWLKGLQVLAIPPCMLGAIFALFAAGVALHSALHPAIALKDVPGPAMGAIFAGAFLLGLPLGLMLANTVMWLIPWWRHALERAFAGVPNATFGEAMRQLRTALAYVALPALAAAAVGIWDPWLR